MLRRCAFRAWRAAEPSLPTAVGHSWASAWPFPEPRCAWFRAPGQLHVCLLCARTAEQAQGRAGGLMQVRWCRTPELRAPGLCKATALPPDVQNIPSPSGQGSTNEIEVELLFPSHTDSFSIILAPSNHVMIPLTSFWGEGKQKQVAKFVLSHRKVAEPLMPRSVEQAEMFQMALTQHSWRAL